MFVNLLVMSPTGYLNFFSYISYLMNKNFKVIVMIKNLYGYGNLNQSQKTGKGGFCRRKGANIAKKF
jgi:hypothetical protein